MMAERKRVSRKEKLWKQGRPLRARKGGNNIRGQQGSEGTEALENKLQKKEKAFCKEKHKGHDNGKKAKEDDWNDDKRRAKNCVMGEEGRQ